MVDLLAAKESFKGDPNAILTRKQILELRQQKLEEKVAQTEASLAREEKARKEVEALNAKLLEEKTTLLKNLEGEKSGLSSIQERAAKLAAQKADLETQLAVSPKLHAYFFPLKVFAPLNLYCFPIISLKDLILLLIFY